MTPDRYRRLWVFRDILSMAGHCCRARGQARGQGSGVIGMLRITRDKAELEDAPFVTFTVYRTSKDNTTVCGRHEFAYQSAERRFCFARSLPAIPVGQAFDSACRYAKSKGVSAIWIHDPNRLFEFELSR
jgi:hypothetical protein